MRVLIAAEPAAVWRAVERVESHVEWMQDARAIRLLPMDPEPRVGLRFECDTRVGPLQLTDLMEITEWDPPRVMGVRHIGAVTGSGRFTLSPAGQGTLFEWEEELEFPWWLGGRAGARAARPVFGWIWRRNLQALRAQVEAAAG